MKKKLFALSNPVFKSLSNSQKLSNIWHTHITQIMDTHLSFYSVYGVFLQEPQESDQGSEQLTPPSSRSFKLKFFS